jgi:hypothetical protein
MNPDAHADARSAGVRPPRLLEEVRPLQLLLLQEAQALKQDGEEAMISIQEQPGDETHPWAGTVHLIESGSARSRLAHFVYNAALGWWQRLPPGPGSADDAA